MKIKINKDIKLAVLGGFLLGVSYPPLPFYFLAFIAFVPYLYGISNRNGLASINRFTYVFAFVFNLITLYWVGSWTKEADQFLMISGAVLLFFNPLLFLIPSSIYAIVKKYINAKTALLLFPFFWVTYEFLYSVTEFRFPWLTLGNSQAYFTPFIQIADLIGVYGISLLILFVNIFLYLSIKNLSKKKVLFNPKYLTFALVIFISPLIYGLISFSGNYDGKKITVGIIQPNLNPWKKWDAGSLDKQIDLYFSLSRKALKEGAQLLVFPETALPVYLTSPRYYRELQRIYDFVDSTETPLLTGMPDYNIYTAENAPDDAKSFRNSSRRYTTYNAVYLFLPHTRKIQEYHKTLLVPFGEKIPYVERFPALEKLFKWEVGISSWNTGEGAKTLTIQIDKDSVKIGAAICIESIYPEYIADFIRKGARALFIVTNDSWYGKSSGPYQHAAISILRAVENRRFVVRAANGGISCIINPQGEITKQTKLFTKTVLVGDISLLNGKTFYTEHSYLIPIVSLLVSFIFLVIALIKKSTNRKQILTS